jgi:hypothetical protein
MVVQRDPIEISDGPWKSPQKEKCRRTNESIHDQLKCQDLLTGLSHLSYDEKCPFVVHLDSSKKNKMFPAPRLYSMYVYKAFQWL